MAKSIKNQIAGKLEDALAEDLKEKLSSESDKSKAYANLSEEELFTFAEYSAEEAERTGYSNFASLAKIFSTQICKPFPCYYRNIICFFLSVLSRKSTRNCNGK